MSSAIRVFLVDDHTILRDGLKAIINPEKDLEVVGEASTGPSAVQQLHDTPADVVIMDYHLKGNLGTQAIPLIHSHFPDIQVMALTSYDEKGIVRSMVKAGAISYVLKDAEQSELLDAIRSTGQGESWFSKEVSRILLGDLLPGKPTKTYTDTTLDPSILSAREVDVLKLIVGEKTNREIAQELHISPKTVDNHRANLMQKIGARNTAGLVKYALRHNLSS